jgi:hypothetical protein
MVPCLSHRSSVRLLTDNKRATASSASILSKRSRPPFQRNHTTQIRVRGKLMTKTKTSTRSATLYISFTFP